MNYGVRWDRIRPWDEKYNQLQTLVEGEQSQVFPGAPEGLVFPGDPGVPDSLAPARNNFSPRIGRCVCAGRGDAVAAQTDGERGSDEHPGWVWDVLHGV